MPHVSDNDLKRFDDKITLGQDGCWHWTAFINPTGYGQFRFDGRMQPAHRAAYQMFVGDIPPGTEIDHLCRNRDCVNYEHLEAVTHFENVMRGESFSAVNSQMTHCIRGHPFDEENTYIGAQGRMCRRCKRDRQRKYRLTS